MGKKKSKKKKKITGEELSLLGNIDKNIISQYSDIRNDIEDFQYQLAMADKKNRKKFRKAMKEGKSFNYMNSISVHERKKIIKKMENDNFLERVIKICEDFIPILKLLGRCVSLLIVAILSLDSVKASITQETMGKMEKAFRLGMSL